MLFADAEGKRLGESVRLVKLETNDPRFSEVGRYEQATRERRQTILLWLAGLAKIQPPRDTECGIIVGPHLEGFRAVGGRMRDNLRRFLLLS